MSLRGACILPQPFAGRELTISAVIGRFDESVIVRPGDAEVVGRAPTTGRLLADSGALFTIRVSPASGADGARPHHHAGSAELFYLLDGTAQPLSGEQIETAERGDHVVVPPKLAHAFAAAPGENADILIVIAPKGSSASNSSAISKGLPTARFRRKRSSMSRNSTIPIS